MGDDFLKEKKDKGPSWVHFLFAGIIFVLVFCYPWQTESDWEEDEFILAPEYPWQARKNWRGHGYFFGGDTHTYILFNAWKHPWRSHRSLGYPAFLYPFLYPDHQKFDKAQAEARKNGPWWAGTKKPIYTVIAEIGLAEKFETVALVQRWILALAIVLFYLALIRWFPPLFSFLAMAAALWLAPPPDPLRIMTEPLSCSLAWFCAAFLLFAPKTRHHVACVALASLCAAVAFLVRPQMLSLTALLSLLFLYCLLLAWLRSESVRSFFKASLAFSPLLISYGYIVWLSVTGGHLFLHTHHNVSFITFCYFGETADALHMPTERARKLTQWFGEHKAEFINKILTLKSEEALSSKIRITGHESPVRKMAVLGDSLIYLTGWPETMEQFKNERGIGRLSLLEGNILGRELTSGLRQRHSGEMLTSTWQNFIGALGYYSDVWHLTQLPHLSFAFNIVALGLCAWVLIISDKARWPLIMMMGIHLMCILTAACGLFVIRRYVESTEAFLLLAGMCSLWILFCRGWGYLRPQNAGVAAPV